MTPFCDEVQERLFELLESSSEEGPELAGLRGHYAGCLDCQREGQRLTRLLGLTRATLLPTPELETPGVGGAAHRESIRRRLGLIPPPADLRTRLQTLKDSERLELLRQATRRVVELFRLPDWEEFEGLWRVGLATARHGAPAGDRVTPKSSFQDAGELVEYALLLEQQAEQGAALTALEAPDLDPVGAAFLREILAGSGESG